jgi:hypothetical protein
MYFAGGDKRYVVNFDGESLRKPKRKRRKRRRRW